MTRFLLLLALVTQMTGLNMPSQTAQRVPLEKEKIVLKSPTSYEKRVLRHDSKTGEPVHYDPRPRVHVLNTKSRKYALKWIGYDGKEKTIIFQRASAIDAVVSASVTRSASRQYVYTYRVTNLKSSGAHLKIFAIQNYSSNVSPIKSSNLYVGGITRNRRVFKDGNWLGFGLLTPNIIPGESIDFKLVSEAPPGLVECRVAGGEQGMKGVGEHMPQELENVLPGYADWPYGLTVGPHDWLKTATSHDKLNYIRQLVPRMRELGWITTSSSRWYEENLISDDFDRIIRHVDEDFRKGQITSEVRDLLKITLIGNLN